MTLKNASLQDPVILRISSALKRARKMEKIDCHNHFPTSRQKRLQRKLIRTLRRRPERFVYLPQKKATAIAETILRPVSHFGCFYGKNFLNRWEFSLYQIAGILDGDLTGARILEVAAGKSNEGCRSWMFFGEPISSRVLARFGVDIVAIDPKIDPVIEKEIFGLCAIKGQLNRESARLFRDKFDLIFGIYISSWEIFEDIVEAIEEGGILKAGGVFLEIRTLASHSRILERLGKRFDFECVGAFRFLG